MNSAIPQILLNPNQVLVRAKIIFDWSDGPREGIIDLVHPESSWAFKILAEGRISEDLSDNLYELSALPDDSTSRAREILAELAPPNSGSWAPMWKFTNVVSERRARTEIDQLLAQAAPVKIIVRSSGLDDFSAAWSICWQL